MEELAEVSKVFSQDRVQQRFGKQTIEPPAISLAVEIIEVPDTRTQDKTQHVVNTHVQHVVNTVEVERPKLAKRDSSGEDQPGDQAHQDSTGAVP